MKWFQRSMRYILLLSIAAVTPVCLSAQQTTTTATPKVVTRVLTVESAEVVYVSGDDAVLKLPDGSLRLFEVTPGTELTIDGKQAQPSDLKPGMRVAHLQLHSRVVSDVTEVKQIEGTILRKLGGNTLQLRLEDGTVKMYRVPRHATFNINGKTNKRDANFNSLTTGMKISVTAVTTSGLHTHSTSAAKVATTPPQQGTLVIEK